MLSFEEKYSEIASIERQLRNIEEKQLQQVEYIQQLATKRAEEREKSLQEVVIQERTRSGARFARFRKPTSVCRIDDDVSGKRNRTKRRARIKAAN